MVHAALKRIGLTDGEIAVYLALLELGSSSTGPITSESSISGSKVYEVLERLEQKGLVTEATMNGVRHFEATDPNRILHYIDEKKVELEEEREDALKIIPELLLKKQSSPQSEVKVFLGWEGIKSANEDIIRTLDEGEEWLSMGLTEQPASWERYFTKRQHVRAQKGIIHKHLLNENYRALYKNRKHLPHTEFRFLQADLEMPTSTEIYADKVIIMLLNKDHPMAIMIQNPEIAESFRKYFFVMWNRS